MLAEESPHGAREPARPAVLVTHVEHLHTNSHLRPSSGAGTYLAAGAHVRVETLGFMLTLKAGPCHASHHVVGRRLT